MAFEKWPSSQTTSPDGGNFGKPLIVKCTHRAISVDASYSTAMAVTDTAIHEIDCLHWLLNDK